MWSATARMTRAVDDSHSLYRGFDENFAIDRTNLIIPEVLNITPREVVLTFPVAHTGREKRHRSGRAAGE